MTRRSRSRFVGRHDINAQLSDWLYLLAPPPHGLCVLEGFAHGHCVIADSHVTVASGSWHQEVHDLLGLPVGHCGAEFSMQPSQLACACSLT